MGPVKISDIKNNNKYPENGLEMNLKYLFSCINGTIRHWYPIKNEKMDQ